MRSLLAVVLVQGGVVVRAEEGSPRPVEAPGAPSGEGEGGSRLPDWLSRVELSGFAFLFYRYELSKGGKDLHTFDLGRAYLTVMASPVAHLRLKLTADAPSREPTTTVKDGVATVSQASGRFDVVLKHGFGEVYDLVIPGLSVRLGMQDLPWLPFFERAWGYRFQGPMFADREGYLSTTDLGLGVLYAMPGKWLEAHAVLMHGETWQKPEVSKHKDLQARLTVRPFAGTELAQGLSLSVVGNLGKYEAGPDRDRHRLLAGLMFEHPFLFLALEYLRGWDPSDKLAARHPSLLGAAPGALATAQGLALYGWLDLGLFGVLEGVRLVGRFDSLDPAAAVQHNDHRREIVGVGYRANKYASVLLDAELVQYDAGAGVKNDEARIYLSTQLGF